MPLCFTVCRSAFLNTYRTYWLRKCHPKSDKCLGTSSGSCMRLDGVMSIYNLTSAWKARPAEKATAQVILSINIHLVWRILPLKGKRGRAKEELSSYGSQHELVAVLAGRNAMISCRCIRHVLTLVICSFSFFIGIESRKDSGIIWFVFVIL